ncbi:hypothetical protein F5Y15DRAFT_173984 [Xylariaceae sp. FL0016]|nr:hypothetical protein F5Y15DRAFT_173984 [Xylariaceae sp. FL0016]
MTVTFIDNAAIDQRTRKLIRSQAAKGKNIGRVVHRPSRRHQTRQVAQKPVSIRKIDTEASMGKAEGHERSTVIERPICHGFSVYGVLSELSRTSLSTFHKAFTFINGPLYPAEISRVVNTETTTTPFIKFAFVDEAFFHCMVALALQVKAQLRITEEESMEALRHLNCSLRMINQRLSSMNAPSDPTLAAVLAVAQHERIKGSYQQALVHMNGLQQMIELRGGIVQLVSRSPVIAQKALRADLDLLTCFRIKTNWHGFGADTTRVM